MKICPVCNASAFDDAPTCFGCLHDFSKGALEEPTKPATCEEAPITPEEEQRSFPMELPPEEEQRSFPMELPPEFRIRFVPSCEQAGVFTWSCAVEMA